MKLLSVCLFHGSSQQCQHQFLVDIYIFWCQDQDNQFKCQVLVQDPGGNVPGDSGQLSGHLRGQLQPQHAAAPLADLLLHR